MGDFNDIRIPDEKNDRHPHPHWLMEEFNFTIETCDLSYLDVQGHKFTWERGRGTPQWVEERLNRILVSQSWLNLFDRAVAESCATLVSDHLSLIIRPISRHLVKRITLQNFSL
nr:uncharacterized protein LOC109179326 [Ipomoea batatas]